MNIQGLRYFISVAQHLNFTKAANEFYIAQSAMSQQIQRLEKEIGVKLFQRENKKITLTKEGSVFLEDACMIVNRYDRAVEKLHSMQTGHKEVLHIAFIGQYERVFLPQLVSTIKKQHSNIQLKLHYCPLDRIEYELEQGLCDLVFGYPYEFIDNEILQTKTLFQDSISLVVSQSHPLAKKDSIDYGDWGKETIIMVQSSHSPKNFSRMKQDFKNYGYYPCKIEQVQNFDTMLLMVEAGSGIAFVPSNIQVNSSLKLKFYPIQSDGIHFTHEIAAIYLKSNDDPLIQLFISTSLEFFQERKYADK